MEGFDVRCVAPMQVTCYLHVVLCCSLCMYVCMYAFCLISCLCLYSHYLQVFMYVCRHCMYVHIFHFITIMYVCMYAYSMLLPPTNCLCMYIFISQFYIATHSQRMSLYVIVFRCILQYFIV